MIDLISYVTSKYTSTIIHPLLYVHINLAYTPNNHKTIIATAGARECHSNVNDVLGADLVTEEIHRLPRACLRDGHDVVTRVGGCLDHHLFRGEARGAVCVRGCE